MKMSLLKPITSSICALALCLTCGVWAAAESNLTVIEEQSIPLAASSTSVLTPKASGTATESGGGATVDYSNCNDGYIMAKYTGGGRIKIRITKQGSKMYTYDLRSDGVYETFPMSGGDGNYSVEVFVNVSGNQYSQAMSASFTVALSNAYLPFLYPSQYVNFNAKSKVVAYGASLANGSTDQLTIVSNVYNYVIGNISYDTNKAKTVQPGYLPSVDKILAAKKGICFDYAAVMASMLRSQGIPTRLNVGYVSTGAYHAWISVYINGTGWVNNVIYFDGKKWKLMDPTFASSSQQSTSIMQYIGDGKNYKTEYVY